MRTASPLLSLAGSLGQDRREDPNITQNPMPVTTAIPSSIQRRRLARRKARLSAESGKGSPASASFTVKRSANPEPTLSGNPAGYGSEIQ